MDIAQRSMPLRWQEYRVPRGVTLLELMVAISLAVVLFGSVYYVYAISSRGFKAGEEIMRATNQARFALEQLTRDIGMAGFLATPNSVADDENVCYTFGGTQLLGIYFQKELGDTYLPGAGNHENNIYPSAVVLFGAYPSTEVYTTESVVGNVITLTADSSFPASQPEFDRIFNSNHIVRLVTEEQFELYFKIDSANYVNRTVTLTESVPQANPPDYCGIQGFGEGLELSVVGFVRYILRRDTREGAPQDKNGTITKIDLVREELDPNRNLVAGSRLVVAEYVVDLEFYDFVLDEDLNGNDPEMNVYPTIADVVPGILDDSVGARPEDLRFVTVVVSTRTEHEDPSVPFRARATATGPLDLYEADPDMFGAARVVSVGARVGLRSFAMRNAK